MMLNKISTLILPLLIITILSWGIVKRQPVYEYFIEGAKDGFGVAIKIIPYLVAIIFAVTVFRASGLLDFITAPIAAFTNNLGLPTEVIPVVFTRPLSGAAALGVFSDLAYRMPPDSYAVKLAAIIIGSSETTFYVLSVYFGSVGIIKFRYALLTGIIADIAGIAIAVMIARLFFY